METMDKFLAAGFYGSAGLGVVFQNQLNPVTTAFLIGVCLISGIVLFARNI